MAQLGYTNIMVFRDGIPAWVKAGYPLNTSSPLKKAKVPSLEPATLKASLDDVYIIDIRPPSVYDKGYIKNSRAIPLGFLSFLVEEIPRNQKLVVVDHKGKQCKTAAKWLKNNGFKDVAWLKGGLTAWAKKGYPVEK